MRVHGTKNKKTPLRDAEEALAKARTGEAMVDPLHVMETIMMHYHTQAFSKKALNKPEAEIDAAMALGLHAAEQCAPYRHRPVSQRSSYLAIQTIRCECWTRLRQTSSRPRL